MMLAHIMGIPVEESVLQLAPACAAIVTAVAIGGRTTLGRLRRSVTGSTSRKERMLRRRSVARSGNGTPGSSSM
jgi:hypothetical protein